MNLCEKHAPSTCLFSIIKDPLCTVGTTGSRKRNESGILRCSLSTYSGSFKLVGPLPPPRPAPSMVYPRQPRYSNAYRASLVELAQV